MRRDDKCRARLGSCDQDKRGKRFHPRLSSDTLHGLNRGEEQKTGKYKARASLARRA